VALVKSTQVAGDKPAMQKLQWTMEKSHQRYT